MKITVLLAMMSCIPLLLTGCSTGLGTDTGRMDIRGTITHVSPGDSQALASGILGQILIEGALEKDTAFDKASVTVRNKARILRKSGSTITSATFADLKTGQRVEARFTGAVAESYPVQAVAEVIVILD